MLHREERIITQSTESLLDVHKQHETVAEVESAIEIKQEVEDGGESSSALALPQDQLGRKRKRSTSPVAEVNISPKNQRYDTHIRSTPGD